VLHFNGIVPAKFYFKMKCSWSYRIRCSRP